MKLDPSHGAKIFQTYIVYAYNISHVDTLTELHLFMDIIIRLKHS
jgi:hypothetical protein